MSRTKPLIGVTGVIGSGKSTVARLFAKLGCAVFDSDEIARQITKDPETLRDIAAQFDAGLLDSSGQLNRTKMAEIVFNNPDQLRKLNGIIHPRVRKKMWDFVEQAEKNPAVKMVFVDSPLIYETDLHRYLDLIVVVAASEEDCISRVEKRNNLSRKEILMRMSRQIPLNEKINRADFVIFNDKTIDDLPGQVEEIFEQINKKL